jgi:hypothetical protein
VPNAYKLWILKYCRRLTCKESLQLLAIPQIKLANRGHYVPSAFLLDNGAYEVSDCLCYLRLTRSVESIYDKESRGRSRPIFQNLSQVMIKAKL